MKRVGMVLLCAGAVFAAASFAADAPKTTLHYADLSGGQVHYVTAGEGDAVLLLLSGEDDFFVNQERLDYTCTIFPVCEVHPLIPGAGAFIGLEQPEAYAAAVVAFLNRP